MLAGLGAMLAGRGGLQAPIRVGPALTLLGVLVVSNLWLTWRVRAGRTTALMNAAGLLVCVDVLVLSWLLLESGGALNPASVFYLVQIVLAALVLGRRWTWIVASLSVAGYAGLFLTPTSELRSAQSMHPEIAVHMNGMWLAFALTALLIAILVTRLAIAVERRDRALEAMRDKTARAARLAGLATLAAGAAHELSTPLATIAVAANELERTLAARGAEPGLQEDARLIRAEIDRCRRVLDDMAGRTGEPSGDAPRRLPLGELLDILVAQLRPDERARVAIDATASVSVLWPPDAIVRALTNLIRNGLQASAAPQPVRLRAELTTGDHVRLTVVDQGIGMSAEDLARAGEPFFTTKPAGAGTGLGLFVTRSSIEQLGGSVSLMSSPGRGTTATVTLPRDVVSPEARS